MEKINSPIFGESIIPSRAQELMIKGMVENSPVAVFKALNDAIYKSGYELFVVKNHDRLDFTVVYPTLEFKR